MQKDQEKFIKLFPPKDYELRWMTQLIYDGAQEVENEYVQNMVAYNSTLPIGSMIICPNCKKAFSKTSDLNFCSSNCENVWRHRND